MEKIGVFLIDSHVIFRRALQEALSQEEDIEVLGEASIGEEALSAIGSLSPRVVILDANLPALKDLDLPHKITQRLPRVHLIVLGDYESSDQIFLAIEAGAAAFLTRTTPRQDFITAIRNVSQGEYLINEGLLSRARLSSPTEKQAARFLVGEGPAGTEVSKKEEREAPAEVAKPRVRILIEKGVNTVYIDGKKQANFKSLEVRVDHLSTTCKLSGVTHQGRKYGVKFRIEKGNIELEVPGEVKLRL